MLIEPFVLQTKMADLRLTMEDILRGGFLESGVPDEADAVRVVSVLRVLVVAGEQQFRENSGPVHRSDHSVLRPALVVKAAVQRELVATTWLRLRNLKVVVLVGKIAQRLHSRFSQAAPGSLERVYR